MTFHPTGLRLAAAAFLAAAAMMPASRPAHAATPADTLVMARNIDDIIGLDPAEVYEFSSSEILNNVYERLFTFDPRDFTKVIGGVADTWALAPDGKTLTIKIKPDLKFHSGNPVTAADAAFSLQRVVILGKLPAFILTQFGWKADNVREMVTAPDDATLVLKLSQPFAPSFVLNCLSASVASVVDMKEVLAHEADGDLGYNWLKSRSAGSGAYRIAAWQPKQAAVLEANPGFARGAPKLRRVIVRHVPESTAQRLLLEKGDVDIARNLTSDQVAAISGNADLVVQTTPKTTIYYLALNQKYEPLTKPGVRKALRWLVDYKGLADSVLKGQWVVHQAFWGSGAAGALDDNPFSLDPAKAKALLAEAGYPDGFTMTLDVSNTDPYLAIAQSLQATFAKGGVKVEIVQEETKQMLTRYRARQHQGLIVYWSPDYLDPNSTAEFFAANPDNSDNATNKSGAWRNAWEIPELTSLTYDAIRIKDTAERLETYVDLQRTIQEDSPFVVMFQQTDQAVLRSNVKDFIPGPSFDTPVYWLVTK
jgi:peptide/nickel transport system substrate-binding protein